MHAHELHRVVRAEARDDRDDRDERDEAADRDEDAVLRAAGQDLRERVETGREAVDDLE